VTAWVGLTVNFYQVQLNVGGNLILNFRVDYRNWLCKIDVNPTTYNHMITATMAPLSTLQLSHFFFKYQDLVEKTLKIYRVFWRGMRKLFHFVCFPEYLYISFTFLLTKLFLKLPVKAFSSKNNTCTFCMCFWLCVWYY
jgi:hypothetical protein